MKLAYFLRFVIGGILLSTAVGKFLDLPGFSKVLETYQTFAPFFLPVIAWGMPLAEFFLAIWLFSGIRLFEAALAAMVLHIFFSALATITLLRGIQVPNCGCFGIFWARPLTWGTVAEDGFMTALCLTLAYITGKKEHR